MAQSYPWRPNPPCILGHGAYPFPRDEISSGFLSSMVGSLNVKYLFLFSPYFGYLYLLLRLPNLRNSSMFPSRPSEIVGRRLAWDFMRVGMRSVVSTVFLVDWLLTKVPLMCFGSICCTDSTLDDNCRPDVDGSQENNLRSVAGVWSCR
jgi:hypothetical protein